LTFNNYSGSITSWANVEVESYHNDALYSAICYYSETVPTDGDNSYWYYDANGSITVWTLYKVAKVEASCTDGHEEYYKSTTSDKIYKDEAGTMETTLEELKITALGHSLIHHAAKDATTTTVGTIAYYSCENCGKLFTDEAGSLSANIMDILLGTEQVTFRNNSVYSCNNSSAEIVVIPSVSDGQTIKSIDTWAFNSNYGGHNTTNLKSVVIPNTITNIYTQLYSKIQA